MQNTPSHRQDGVLCLLSVSAYSCCKFLIYSHKQRSFKNALINDFGKQRKKDGGGCFNSLEYFSQAQNGCWQCNFAKLCRFFGKHLRKYLPDQTQEQARSVPSTIERLKLILFSYWLINHLTGNIPYFRRRLQVRKENCSNKINPLHFMLCAFWKSETVFWYDFRSFNSKAPAFHSASFIR